MARRPLSVGQSWLASLSVAGVVFLNKERRRFKAAESCAPRMYGSCSGSSGDLRESGKVQTPSTWLLAQDWMTSAAQCVRGLKRDPTPGRDLSLNAHCDWMLEVRPSIHNSRQCAAGTVNCNCRRREASGVAYLIFMDGITSYSINGWIARRTRARAPKQLIDVINHLEPFWSQVVAPKRSSPLA